MELLMTTSEPPVAVRFLKIVVRHLCRKILRAKARTTKCDRYNEYIVRRILKVLFILFFCFSVMVVFSSPVNIKIFKEDEPGISRFILQLSDTIDFSTLTYQNNIKINKTFHIDFKDVNIAKGTIPVQDGIVENIVITDVTDSNITRVKFYLKSNDAEFELACSNDPPKIQISVIPPIERKQAGIENRGFPSVSQGTKKTIIIDPGHGGQSLGAKSGVKVNFGRYKQYIYEKDIVLELGKKLRDLINKSPNMRAFLTREKDVYVSLQERVDFALQNKGDMFISLHLNAPFSRKRYEYARGIEIFYLDPKGVRSALTDFENDFPIESNAKNISPLAMLNLKNIEEDIINKLTWESVSVAENIVRTFRDSRNHRYFRQYNRGIKGANFRVLKNDEMPAILVEIGFVTHTEDLRLLFDESFRYDFFASLFNGINDYFKSQVNDPYFVAYKYPYSSTLSKTTGANDEEYISHLVKKGDNLWGISKKYGASVEEIKKINNLKSESLEIGKSIKIPVIRSSK